jgi:hypothetical protein
VLSATGVSTGAATSGVTVVVESVVVVSSFEAPPQAVKKAKETITKANFNDDFMILERLNVNEKLNFLKLYMKIGFWFFSVKNFFSENLTLIQRL